jgi:hypothetical protein
LNATAKHFQHRSIEREVLMGWREVIYHYLRACVADSRKAPWGTSRSRFIDALGTTALKHREQQSRAQNEKRVASQQVPAPETYKEIETSPTRVIAEVEKANLLELFLTIRFLVVKVDDQWQLDDIFWKCSCENGTCFFCRGAGYCTACHGKGFARWFFGLLKPRCIVCNGQPGCTFCGGKGRCKYCLESPLPGWTSRTRIISDANEGG